MLKCASCGAENKDDAKFCFSCGVPIAGTAPAPSPTAVPPPLSPPPPPPWWTWPREKGPDFMGLVGLAFFLFVVGFVFYANPNLGTDLRLWSDRVVRNGLFARPPEGVITSAVLFFFLMGIASFVTATLRVVVGRHRFRALSDVIGGVALVLLSFLLSLYASRTISGQLVLATWAAVLGVLLLIYISLGIYFSWMRHVPRPGPSMTTRP